MSCCDLETYVPLKYKPMVITLTLTVNLSKRVTETPFHNTN